MIATREQIEERQPIFDGLCELYEHATGHKIEIFYNAFVVYTGENYENATRFSTGEHLIEYVLTELRDYMLGGAK